MKHLKRLYIDGVDTQFVKLANTWWSRLKGLLGTLSLQNDHGLWLIPCDSIHTIGMLYSIDVVFLNKEAEVCRICKDVKPFRFRFAPKGTHSVLEFNAGGADRLGVKLGQKMSC